MALALALALALAPALALAHRAIGHVPSSSFFSHLPVELHLHHPRASSASVSCLLGIPSHPAPFCALIAAAAVAKRAAS
jgi:hypothetical protein